MPKKPNPSSDLRGAVRITIDAIKGVTDLVEAMHHTIASLGGLLSKPGQKRTRGITGLVYRSIRTVTGWVGGGLDAFLDKLTLIIEDKESSPGREAMLAAVNGVLGDYLADKENPLTISMQLRKNGRVISVEKQTLSELVQQSNGKIILMVHGSCMNDLQWNRQGHDHGAMLASDFGYLSVYLHYNSGRHISENGREFAHLLESFIKKCPQPIELMIIAHSMGGLVSRSACFYAKQTGHSWLSQLQKIIFLGTPHHGAPLEKGGNWIDNILEISPYSKPFSRMGKIRSAGITDLRYGNIVDEDWKGQDRFKLSKDPRIPVHLPNDVACYAIAATTGKESSKVGDALIGDGLVPLNSALGRHKNPDLNLLFPENQQWIGRNMNHLDLLNHPDVYEIITQWLK